MPVSQRHSASPMVLLRISDGQFQTRRAFHGFAQALHSAEAYASAGFKVAMVSATGRFLMAFDPRESRARPRSSSGEGAIPEPPQSVSGAEAPRFGEKP